MEYKNDFFFFFCISIFLYVCVSFSNLLNATCWSTKCLSFVFGSNNCMNYESQHNCHDEDRGKEMVTFQLLWFLGAMVLPVIELREKMHHFFLT